MSDKRTPVVFHIQIINAQLPPNREKACRKQHSYPKPFGYFLKYILHLLKIKKKKKVWGGEVIATVSTIFLTTSFFQSSAEQK